MRRIQIYIDEPLDDSLETEARRQGTSKAALIRRAVARDLGSSAPSVTDPWEALSGWLDDDPVDDIGSIIYRPPK